LGGVFDISSNPGRGTRISLKVPILQTREVQDGKTNQ
jgi:chemotaxis protein histidine kinase CheA